MKLFSLLFFLLVVSSAYGQKWPKTTVVGKVALMNGKYYLYTKENNKTVAYPLTLKNKNLVSIIQSMEADDEAVLRGEIELTSQRINESMVFEPHFVITEIVPVSLKKLAAGKPKIKEPLVFLKSSIDPYARPGIVIPNKVAAAMIFTSALLMANKAANFSGGGGNSLPPAELKNGVILSVGALATGTMIDDYLRDKKQHH